MRRAGLAWSAAALLAATAACSTPAAEDPGLTSQPTQATAAPADGPPSGWADLPPCDDWPGAPWQWVADYPLPAVQPLGTPVCGVVNDDPELGLGTLARFDGVTREQLDTAMAAAEAAGYQNGSGAFDLDDPNAADPLQVVFSYNGINSGTDYTGIHYLITRDAAPGLWRVYAVFGSLATRALG